MLLTSGRYVVQIWSRNTLNFGPNETLDFHRAVYNTCKETSLQVHQRLRFGGGGLVFWGFGVEG